MVSLSLRGPMLSGVTVLTASGVEAETLTSSVIPLTSRLGQAFTSRLLYLPPDTRSVLLVAASGDVGALGEVLAAASEFTDSDVSPESLSPAVAIGLITADEYRIRFSHPVARSAVLQTASLAERLAAHGALAAILHGQSDRQTWHRAMASGQHVRIRRRGSRPDGSQRGRREALQPWPWRPWSAPSHSAKTLRAGESACGCPPGGSA
jgi:hypothetical protein